MAKYLGKSISFFILLCILLESPGQGSEGTLLILEIQWENKREEVLDLRVKDHTTLTLAYTHSLFLTPQNEVYTIHAGSLILREINFGNLEAAGYYDSNPLGGVHPEGGLWKINPPFPFHFSSLRVRIPTTVHFCLIINGSVVWTPRDKDRGALLIVRTGPGR